MAIYNFENAGRCEQDRIAFIENMMTRCMNMIFSEIDEESRKEVATAMLTKLADVLKEQLLRRHNCRPNPQ